MITQPTHRKLTQRELTHRHNENQECLRRNAADGDPRAMLGLGVLHDMMDNKRTARRLFEGAARRTISRSEGAQTVKNRGLPTAHYQLGMQIYEDACSNGHAPHDYKRAFTHFAEGALAGHAGSAYFLSELYAAGLGVAQSDGKAQRWLYAAAKGGHPRARTRVSEPVLKALDRAEEKARLAKLNGDNSISVRYNGTASKHRIAPTRVKLDGKNKALSSTFSHTSLLSAVQRLSNARKPSVVGAKDIQSQDLYGVVGLMKRSPEI